MLLDNGDAEAKFALRVLESLAWREVASILENHSRNTVENAVYSNSMVLPSGSRNRSSLPIPGSTSRSGPQVNPNTVVPQDLRGSIEVLVTGDFECNVMKSPLVADQLQHMVMVASCAEKEVPGRSIDNLKSAAMNIKVRLAIQVANAERDVREALDKN